MILTPNKYFIPNSIYNNNTSNNNNNIPDNHSKYSRYHTSHASIQHAFLFNMALVGAGTPVIIRG